MDSLQAAHHALHVPAVNHTLALLCTLSIEAKEGSGRDINKKLRSVFEHGRAETIKGSAWCALGIGFRLYHLRRVRADEHSLGHSAGAVTPDVTGDFPTACGVANQHYVLEVEMLDRLGKIISPSIH